MLLDEVIKSCEAKIFEGSPYGWTVLGEDRWVIIFKSSTSEINCNEVFCVIDRQSKEVLSLEVYINKEDKDMVYNWVKPMYLKEYEKKIMENPSPSYTQCLWVLDEFEILDIAHSAILEQEISDKNRMNIDLDVDVMLGLIEESKASNISVSDVVNKILRIYIDHNEKALTTNKPNASI
jgi:hypothetical protein